LAETQNLKNHIRLLPPFHFFVIPVLLINFFYAIWIAISQPAVSTVWAIVVAAALLTLAFLARIMALRVQDRVIRLEMRHRLKELLPSDLQPRINELTPRQLVALRFASDEEMPGLVGEVLAGRLATPKTIKQSVKNWQGDYLRC
jgi:hypothetical protein